MAGKNFLLIMPFEYGSILPTFTLAKRLISRNHRVFYGGHSDIEPFIRREGFEYISLFSDIYPPNSFIPAKNIEFNSNQLKEHGSKESRPGTPSSQMTLEYYRQIGDGVVAEIMRKNLIDVVIGNDLKWEASVLPARQANIPVHLLLTGLQCFRSSGLPTPDSFLIPDDSLSYKFKNGLEWISIYRERLRGIKQARRLGRPPPPDIFLKEACQKFKLELRCCGEGWAFPVMDEMVTCPRSFDFPQASRSSGRLYLGHTVDLARKESEFDWSWYDPSKKLVYVSMGTHSEQYPLAPEVYEKAIEALRKLPHLQGLINLGAGKALEKFRQNPPGNVVFAKRVPQLAVLRKASLMITNGGLGTVKECILNEVPMIVLPQAFDQNGNAARVFFHDLGEVFGSQTLTVEELTGAIQRILESQDVIAPALKKMKNSFSDETELDMAIARLEGESSL